MTSPTISSIDKCPECGAQLEDSKRHCPTCKYDAGAPNVRESRSAENIKALYARVSNARERASARGCSNEFNDFESKIKNESGVVVCMPATIARSLLEDPKFIYTNYDQLVNAGARKVARREDDRKRCMVTGLLFGSYAKKIIYGALSLTNEGVPTYGDIYCRLRSVTIKKRTSFLEDNSFMFVDKHQLNVGENQSSGYCACWEERHALALAKLSDLLKKGQTDTDWQTILIQSDGRNRKNDDFIEAHIYDNFDMTKSKKVRLCQKCIKEQERSEEHTSELQSH